MVPVAAMGGKYFGKGAMDAVAHLIQAILR
jgi:hypothetical protein